jgi:hypothetical protein
MALLFYIAHVPFDEASQRILNICIESIQKYHPDSEIRICYSEGNLPVSIKSSSSNISLIKSPIQNSSVIGPFYHYLQSQDKRKAVFMHDSMILKDTIEMYTMYPFGFLWHFEGEEYIGVNSIACKDLRESFGNLLREYPSTDYMGCFGLALYSEREPLQKLCDNINFLSFVNHPDRANALMDLERILGFWASALNLVCKDEKYISVCGSIFRFPNAFQRWYTNQSLEEIEEINYPRPIIKAWMNRFLREK